MGKKRPRSGKMPRVVRKTPAKPPRTPGRPPRTPRRVAAGTAPAPRPRPQPAAQDVSVKPPRGLGLGTKFAFLLGAIIVAVALFWGVVLTSIFKGALEDQIMMEGTEIAKTLAILGRRVLLVEQTERQSVFLEDLIHLGKGMSSNIAAAAILDARGEAIASTRNYQSSPGARSVSWNAEGVEVKEGFLRQGNVPVRVFSARITAPEGGRQRVLGKAVVAVDWRKVSRKSAWVVKMIAFSGVLFVFIGVGACVILGRTVTQPIQKLMRDMETVARRDFDHVTRATSSDEIGQLAVAFNRMTRTLKEAEDHRKETEELEDQVGAAMEIQANLLPNKIPQIPSFDIYPYWRSAKEVGGDYYDFIPVDREKLALVVADVSGKGIPGSMVMATARTILHMVVADNPSPSDILMRTNAVVAREIKRGMFVTAMLAILDVPKKTLNVCSAGHNPMVVYRQKTGRCELINPNGIALGFDKGPVFNRTLQEKPVQLSPGDRVVLYTDGVVEAMNAQHEEFGDERFYRFVQKHARLSSKEFVTLLVKALDEHKGMAEQHDDITISTFRVE